MTVSAEDYLAVVTETIGRVAASQREAVGRAADLIAEAVRADGVVHAFGTGHSEALAMEIAGRAGGLVPTNRIALRDLVLLGGEPADGSGPLLERDPAVAHRLYELAPGAPHRRLRARLELRGQRRDGGVRHAGQGARSRAGGDHLGAALRPDDLPAPVRRAS